MSHVDLAQKVFFACSHCQKQLRLDSSFAEFEGGKEELLQNLFHGASSESVDHPLCEECYKAILIKIIKKSDDLQEEEAQYKLTATNLNCIPYNSSTIHIDEELDELLRIERQLQQQEKGLIRQFDALVAEKQRQILQCKEIELIEQRFWDLCFQLEDAIEDYNETKNSISNKLEREEHQLNDLRRQNILNETFLIECNDHFGTINGNRMGTLQSIPVEWEEMNAAWGSAVLLLFNLSKAVKYKFIWYRVIPEGSFSKMQRLEGGEILELFFTPKESNAEWKKRYDLALSAFLQCISEIGDFVNSLGRNYRLPFRIADGKIDGIRLSGFGMNDNTTLGCKKLLVNLKYLLHWTIVSANPKAQSR